MSALASARDAAIIEKAVVHVIDDDESVTGALDLLLRSIGLESRTYGSVRQFLDGRAQDRPGCIVLDVRLPGISGLDFQSQCDSLDVRLPIILTGHSDVDVGSRHEGRSGRLLPPFRDQDAIGAI